MRPVISLLKDASAAPAIGRGRIRTASDAAAVPAIGYLHATKTGTAVPDSAERVAIFASIALISIAYFYAAISRSVAAHFWMDEVLAVSAASQSSLSGVWNAIWAGTDFSPPTYHFLLHGFVNAVGFADSRLVWRIPSIVAIYGAAACTYLLLVKSQASRFAAVLAFGLVLALNLFDYAIQVRPYALLALGLAAALLLWSGIDDTRSGRARAFALWLVLAACLCLHFYGIIEVVAIGTAELIYWVTRKRFRRTVWIALLLTAPVQLALYPLASHLAAFNAADSLASAYYAKPTVEAFVLAMSEVAGGGFVMLLLGAALLIAGAAHILERRDRRLPPATQPITTIQSLDLPKLEIVLIALCLLPLMTFAFSCLVTKSFSARYMAAGALLPAIAAAYVLDKSRWRQTIALALVPLTAGILVVRSQAPDRIADALAVLQKAQPPFPIIVGEGLLYIELMQAADAGTRARLVYLKRPPDAVSSDPTNENEVIHLAGFRPEYRVSERDTFLGRNSRFYVLYRPSMSADTTTPALIEQGLLGSPVDAERGILLFRSQAPARMQPGGGAR
jgi:hypothetical protein